MFIRFVGKASLSTPQWHLMSESISDTIATVIYAEEVVTSKPLFVQRTR
jgi:hypothetical protein